MQTLPRCSRHSPSISGWKQHIRFYSYRTVRPLRATRGDDHSDSKPHVTIVGGGAAGLTAAIFAADNGARVTVLERTREAGKKILMSGGSRCNVLPMEVDTARDYHSESPASAVRAVLGSWRLDACRAWLEDPQAGVGLELAEEEETSKLFPASNSSRDVRDALVAAATRRGVRVRYNASLEGLAPAQGTTGSSSRGEDAAGPGPGSPGWVCRLADGSTHTTDSVVIATGGLSFPAVGTDGTGHRILQQLGHDMHAVYPALTPLTGKHPAGHQLAGLSLYGVDLGVSGAPGVAGKKPRKSQRTGLLFTHKGYSGPAILDLSHYAVMAMMRGGSGAGPGSGPRPALRINWTNDPPELWEQRLTAGGSALVSTVLSRCGIRERLADALCEELGLERRKLSELKKGERQALVKALTAYELPYTGHEGYKKAEVTGGGVPLTQVDCRTMESKVLPGVHLCGEILDCFGRIGGFNFYWAWASGRLAGIGAAKAAHAQRQQEAGEQAAAAAASS